MVEFVRAAIARGRHPRRQLAVPIGEYLSMIGLERQESEVMFAWLEMEFGCGCESLVHATIDQRAVSSRLTASVITLLY